MQEEHTENINQLNAYYKDNLDNVSIDPPADMWNRIEASMKEEDKTKGAGYKKWLLGLLFLSLVGSTAGYYYYSSENIPTANQKTIGAPAVSPTTEINSNKEPIEKNNIEPTQPKASTPTSSTTTSTKQKKETIVITDKATKKVHDTTNTVTAEINIPAETKTSKPAPEVIVETPKKKIGFREKHKAELKDSIRPLFIETK